MLRSEFQHMYPTAVEPVVGVPQTRVGDLAAMLRVMGPLNAALPDAADGKRQLLADLCRFIGVKMGTLPPGALPLGTDATHPASAIPPQPNLSEKSQSDAGERPSHELSPRMEQTLRHLLDGNSEKQVARKLELSQHTVHVYVKAIYRRFGVSSRAELLSRHLKK